LENFSNVAFLEKKDGPSLMKSVTFCWTWIFSQDRYETSPESSHEKSGASYLPNDGKDGGFGWTDHRLCGHWNQSLFPGLVYCSERHTSRVYFDFGILR
jgi:hypothetical protein